MVTFDITDQLTEGYNKFIPYYLHPAATYNVGLSRVELPDQGCGGDESMDQGAGGGAGEPGGDLRALRRRRACAGGGGQLSAGQGRGGAEGGGGDCGGVAGRGHRKKADAVGTDSL